MSYDYILRHYSIEVPVNAIVRHTITGRYGIIRPEGSEHRHYVKVQFQGDRHISNCHPEELDYDAIDAMDGVE